MLRSILVALDGSSSSARASRLALKLAQDRGAHVEGIGIVNSAWIQRPEALPIGAIGLKSALDLSKLSTARERIESVVQEFKSKATSSKLHSCNAKSAEGNPVSLVAEAATAHDIVALGKNSIFDIDGELYDLPLCVDKIVREEPRPVLLVPDAPGEDLPVSGRPVLVAFDGSPASSRALHMFALLGFAAGAEVHVLSMAESSGAALSHAKQACELLARHGSRIAQPVGLGATEISKHSAEILDYAKRIDAGMIVMGAYGRRGIREIFGSTTREVLNRSAVVLFLHH